MLFPNLIVVIHETLVDCQEVLILHQSKDYKASYHVCIGLDGTIIYLVPQYKKAFAAANSRFINSNNEIEEINGSVDDFAFHIAIETPISGRDINLKSHSGYTIEQYNSLAWLIAKTGVTNDRIVTHDQIKLIKQNIKEPRNFNKELLFDLLKGKNRTRVIDFGVL